MSREKAARLLYALLSRGMVFWRPKLDRMGHIEEEFKYRASRTEAKPYPEATLGSEVDRTLDAAADNQWYYAGTAARYLYGLYDRVANLNLVEVKVAKAKYVMAADASNRKLSEWHVVVPDTMPWPFVQRAMKVGVVLRLLPNYLPFEATVFGGRKVQAAEALLHEMRAYMSQSELASAIQIAREAALIGDDEAARILEARKK